jgi:protein-S-isoprenylcysteine O-methyltransferase Ste14
MVVVDRRERIEGAGFHALAAMATALWWWWLARAPEARGSFLGSRLATSAPFLLVGPDAIALVLGGAWLAVAFARRRPELPALAWTHFGAAGYAWALSAYCALDDPAAYWGLVGMSALVALSFVFAMRASGVSLLWGPFRFRPWDAPDTAGLRRATRRQTALMWLVFFGLLPVALTRIEASAGWTEHWNQRPWVQGLGALLFFAGAILAILASREMVRLGMGTPLPATCASRLVQSGPYAWIRNPMATGSLGQGVGVAMWLGSPLVGVYALAGITAWEVLVRHEEEAWLEARFGEPYASYREQVPCWFPRLSRRRRC